ncbi:TolC family protein [Helicobacter burdigaliensis]|uniref:TolC family protein n=1 Tax=Helicobacter burdigaliensis TaxID=2315334 RepID=UPI000EF65053|nr:TolC family protein [Helicobacter burdigaliensis]
MKGFFVFLAFSLCLFGENQTLDYLLKASKDNPLLHAKNLQSEAAKKEKQALYSLYLPRIEVGYNAQKLQNPDIFYPKSIEGAYIEANWLLFDGLKREGKLKMGELKEKMSNLEALSTQEQIYLEIIRGFYGVLTLEGRLNALKVKEKELLENSQKFSTLHLAGLAPKDTLEAIKAELFKSSYEIEELGVVLKKARENLSLLSGVAITTLKEESLKEIYALEPKDRLDLQANLQKVKIKKEESSQYNYLPTIVLNNRYTDYHYGTREIPTLPFSFKIEDPEYQNIFGIHISLVVFDSFSTHLQKEAKRIEHLAANSEYSYQKDSQKRERLIAEYALKSAKERISWAKQSLESAKIAYFYAKDKFEAQLIDYTQYLNALSTYFSAKGFYDEARFAYEIKKAEFVYYSGGNLESFVGGAQ